MKKSKIRFSFLILTIVVAALSSAAASETKLTKKKVARSYDMLKTNGGLANLQNFYAFVINFTVDASQINMDSRGMEFSPGFFTNYKAKRNPRVDKIYSRYETEMVRLFAREFTSKELDSLRRFARSKVGRKLSSFYQNNQLGKIVGGLATEVSKQVVNDTHAYHAKIKPKVSK